MLEKFLLHSEIPTHGVQYHTQPLKSQAYVYMLAAYQISF